MIRRPRAIIATALAAAAFVFAACRGKEPYTKETFVMGTKAWVTIAGTSDHEAERIATETFAEMYRIESVMSTWRATSEISRLNAGSNGEPFAVSRELFSLIDSSFFYAAATEGAFDITVRPFVLLWGFQGGPAKVPSNEEITRVLGFVGYGRVTLETSNSTVTLPAGMQLDLAGVAKGYAVDRCVAVLKKAGIGNALINIGGNIFALGEGPDGRGWRIGIRDPHGGMNTVGSLSISNEAVATSGNYENFIEINGTRYGHILDPRTGEPVSSVLSVTVVAPTGLASDALSTGLFVLGPGRAAPMMSRLKGVMALYALPDGEGVRYLTLGDVADRLDLDTIAKEEKQ